MFSSPKQKILSSTEATSGRSPPSAIPEGSKIENVSPPKRHVITPEIVSDEAVRTKASVFGRVFDRLMSAIASDPKQERFISFLGRFGFDFVPIVGPLKKFADARELYRVGYLNEARTLCLISLVEGAIDAGEIAGIPFTAGGSLLFPDEALTELRNVRETVRRLSGGRILFPDPLTLAAKLVVAIPGIRNFTDRILRYGMTS